MQKQIQAAADLGMFSMYGRTGAPQKGAPTKGAVIFCMPEKWATPRVKRRVMSKKGRQFLKRSDRWHTVMIKKGRQFFSRKIGSADPVEGPHIFLNRALLRVNPALDTGSASTLLAGNKFAKVNPISQS